MSLKVCLIVLYLGFLLNWQASATHLKAGEMTAENVAGLTYRFTLTVYTKIESIQDQPDLDILVAPIYIENVFFANVPRTSRTTLDNQTYENVFVFNYTFAGAKTYRIHYSEKNRNSDILNINGGNSGEVSFSVETYILVSPLSAANNHTPDLLVPPIDMAAVGQIFYHNPGAFDTDGDSIAYELITPQQRLNNKLEPVPAYVFPEGLTINALTGEVVWDRPKIKGLYNIAFLIKEYRKGVQISYIMRDMQIEVMETENKPPLLEIPSDTCITAGMFYKDTIFASDPDNDKIRLSAYGELFQSSIATFELPIPNPQSQPAIGIYSFSASCKLVRSQPYQFVFKVEDMPATNISLVDLKTQVVRIVGPAIEQLESQAGENSVQLSWKAYACSNIKAIEIYRKRCDSLKLKASPCELGIVESSGFEKIADVPATSTSFTDNENGKGLKQGNFYCYVLKARFQNNAESVLSDQTCAIPGLLSPLPLKTSVINNQIELSWTKAKADAGDFSAYIIKRGEGIQPTSYISIDTLFSINDTIYIDNSANTTLPYGYKIELDTGNFSNSFESNNASTVFLEVKPGSGKAFISWNYDVPWNNTAQIVYRKKQSESSYSQIATIGLINLPGNYTDSGLSKDDSVCYYLETQGEYCTGFSGILKNRSQEVCILPSDSSAPCAPVLSLIPLECKEVEDTRNILQWKPIDEDSCGKVNSYKLYFAPGLDEEFGVLASLSDTIFVHRDSSSLAGCYNVTAVNQYGIESSKSNTVCTDICTSYRLPNLISPNGDGFNDTFRPFPDFLNVKTVNLEVYNRWGAIVFKYNGDPMIRWNGDGMNGKPLADGVYYYNAVVTFERRLDKNSTVKNLKGWVQISNNTVKEEE